MAGLFPPPRSFCDWVKLITTEKLQWSFSDFAQSWLAGAQMLVRTGTTTVGDIEAVPTLLPEVWHATPLRVMSFLEMTGIRSRRDPDAILAEAVETIESLPGGRSAAGLSPHAPYSTLPRLMKRWGAVIIGAQKRIKSGEHSKTRWKWIGLLTLLLIVLIGSIFGIYNWNQRLKNELEAERAFGQAMSTSAYDSSLLAGRVQANSTSQAATVTALAGDFQAQSTAQAAAIIALTAEVTPTPTFCQDINSLGYDIVSGPELIPAVGTTYVADPPSAGLSMGMNSNDLTRDQP